MWRVPRNGQALLDYLSSNKNCLTIQVTRMETKCIKIVTKLQVRMLNRPGKITNPIANGRKVGKEQQEQS